MRAMGLAMLTAVLTAWPTLTSSQGVDVEAIKKQAEASAAEFGELRALLRSPDENIRLAAFDAMVNHGDPSLFEIATAMALGDSSDVIRARALWEVMSRRASFTALFDPGGELDDDAANQLAELYHGRENFPVKATFAETKCISLYQSNRCQLNYSMSVSGTVVSLTYGDLVGQLALETDGVLRGMLRHEDVGMPFTAEISVR